MAISVVLITYNEEANLRRTLESVKPLIACDGGPEHNGEIILIDNGSTDSTLDIAREFGARVFLEDWKGYAAQKNSAIAKATCDWVLSLDADEALEPELAQEIARVVGSIDKLRPQDPPDLQPPMALSFHEALGYGLDEKDMNGFSVKRKNFFLGRWIKHAGFWPDRKIRLFRRGKGRFIDRPVHEIMQVDGATGALKGALLHHTYPTLTSYIATMNRYSSLGAEIAVSKGQGRFSFLNIAVRPMATFLSMYLLRLGFLDGREGLLLCLYHSVYVSWKYAKAWELARSKERS